jgi:hypothetical protein
VRAGLVRRPYVPRPHLGPAELRTLTFPGTPLSVRVELAPGADLSAAATTWTWEDITAYVVEPAGIVISQGKRDEGSLVDPSMARLTVANDDGRFSRHNPAGPWYPLARNTPIRISVNPGTGWRVRFEGFVNSWPPTWDQSGVLHRVTLSCSGVMRRLSQGTPPAFSAVTRYNLTQPALLEYWPCEDQSGSVTAANVAGGPPMTVQQITFSADSTVAGTGPLPVLSATGSMHGSVRAYTSTAGWQVRLVVVVPSAPGAPLYLADAYSEGTIRRWRLTLDPSADPDRLYLTAYAPDDTLLYSDYLEWDSSRYGAPQVIGIGAVQDGADVTCSLAFGDSIGTSFLNNTITTETLGNVQSVRVAPLHGLTGVTAGQVLVLADAEPSDHSTALDGEAQYKAGLRLLLLCEREGMPLEVSLGEDEYSGAREGPAMAAMQASSLLPLLRECEAAEGGILHEAGFGLGYTFAASLYNQDVALALDYDSGHLAVIGGQDDDQRVRNSWTVSRRNGSSARVADQDSVATEGLYASSTSLAVFSDAVLPDQAAWRVHKGTLTGLRYPQLGIRLHSNPSLIHAWSSCRPGSRVTAAGLPGVIGPDDADLILEGWTERITPYTWDVDMVLSPAQVYDVFEVGDDRLGRVGSAGSSLTAGVSSSATSLSVATPVGSLWTTSRDLPLDIEIGGEQMTVTAISGATSPQTFTVTRSVNGVAKAHSSGAVVDLWRSGVIRLGARSQ